MPTLVTRKPWLCEVKHTCQVHSGDEEGKFWVLGFLVGVCSFYQNVASNITLKPHFLCPAVVKRSEMPVIRSSIYIRLNKATAKCKL